MFRSGHPVAVVPPPSGDWARDADARRLGELQQLIEAARGALERELGAPLVWSPEDPGTGPRWLIGPMHAHGGAVCEVPTLTIDRGRQLLISDGLDLGGVYETFGLLRAVHRLPDGSHPVRDCADATELVERIAVAVADTWPSFRLRGVDWATSCARWGPEVRRASNPIAVARRWLATLGDAHTAVRRSQRNLGLPYAVHATEERAVLWGVPEGSAGWRAGARPGMRLVGEPLAEVWAQTGASPHQRPWLVGRRLLEGPAEERPVEVRGRDGRAIRWSEPRVDLLAQPLVHSRRLASGAGYLKLDAFWPSAEPELDAALEGLRGVEGLIIDLRGNGGGHVAMAYRLRDRFLRGPTTLGTLRYTLPGGGLGPEEVLRGEPAEPSRRWPGPVRFLVDALTFSAAEDCLLGLQGLDHVEVIGEPTGGGSGRVRSLRLLPGWRLTVSSALTWDRRRRCIEGAGLPVDRRVVASLGEDRALEVADRLW